MRRELSPEKIAGQIAKLRQFLGYGPEETLRPTDTIRRFEAKRKSFKLRIVADTELSGRYATTNFDDDIITVASSVWQRAEAGNPRDNFTLAEELGHFAMGHPGERNRTISTDHSARHNAQIAVYEREASQFAGILLVPTDAAVGLTPKAIKLKFGVSNDVARIRYEQIERDLRAKIGALRQLPLESARLINAQHQKGVRFTRMDFDAVRAQIKAAEARKSAVAMGYTGDKCPDCEERSLRSDGKITFCENCGWPRDCDGELN